MIPAFDWKSKLVFAPQWVGLLDLMNVALLAIRCCWGGNYRVVTDSKPYFSETNN